MATEAVLQLRTADAGDRDDAVSDVPAGRPDVCEQAGAEADGQSGPDACPTAGLCAGVLQAPPDAGAAGPAGVPAAREGWAIKAARLDGMLADPGLCAVLCDRLAEGETLAEIAQAWDIPAGRLRRWLMEDETRYTAYRRALQIDAHRLVQEAVAIADHVPTAKLEVQHARLRIETRFKTAAYHDRETYGEQAGGGGGKTQVNVIVQRSPSPVAIEAPTQGD